MKKQLGILSLVTILVMSLFALSALATDAEMYFSTDKNGQNRVTNIQEGDEVFIVIYDPDQNIDCDIRDKFTGDTKIMDPKTGAYIIWDKHDPFDPANPTGDFFEETGADTGLFVSDRSFQVGTRESFATQATTATGGKYALFTHVVDNNADDFQWGHFLYTDTAIDADALADNRAWLDFDLTWKDVPFVAAGNGSWANGKFGIGELPHGLATSGYDYTIGRFENMDTLVGMFQDPNDPTDVAVAMMKIIDTEATIAWDKEVYKDANGSATITVVDPDENLNCNEIEYVPVFIIVNPGSWNLQSAATDANSFCTLKNRGGYSNDTGTPASIMRWYNIYDNRFIYYPTVGNVTNFDVVANYTQVVFFAQETGVSTGVFQLNLNSILVDLGFNSMRVRDVLVAYYLDPNDEDDFKLATAYIEEHQHSITSFTNATRADKDLFWIGRDPVYVQVIDANANVDPCCPEQVVVFICDPHGEDDAEWVVLDETSSNSPVFFTNAGMQLWPVWDALGVGLVDGKGGFQLQLDNWKLEVFNEDDVYARYNDVYYLPADINRLGDQVSTGVNAAFPPTINRVRVFNDISFDVMSIADTQVYDGTQTSMYFLDRNGNRVSGYVNSDCVFIEVVDIDQDEDQYRRERIDGFWDGQQNFPFGPVADVDFSCTMGEPQTHPVNALLGNVNIFNDGDRAKLYVLNPRSGRWAAVDLLETGVATGDFVSVICIDLTSVYSECVPTLNVLPGDTIVAFYQDPSNHSDSAMISIKVGIGGGGTPPSQASSAMFVDAAGNEVSSYTDADKVYVKVIDPSHAGAATLANAVEIDGVTYGLTPLAGAQNDTFITAGLELGLVAGDSITATYTDPTDPTDKASDTITVIASELDVVSFYAGPNPCDGECTFGFNGSGIATVMSVTVYDLSGHKVWSAELANVSEIVWNGTNTAGAALANGGYIYVIMATDGTNTFNGKGTVFINR